MMSVQTNLYKTVNNQDQSLERKETNEGYTSTSMPMPASKVDGVRENFFNKSPDSKPCSLQTAVLACSVESVRTRLKNGENVNKKDFMGWSLVHLAIGTSRLAMLDELLKFDVNLELRTEEETPLLMAARMNCLKTMHVLLKAGANVDAQNSEGWSSAHWAVLFNDVKMLGLLVKYKANLELRTEENQQTPLLMAADTENSEIMDALLKAGANPDARDSAGQRYTDYKN